MQNNTDEPPKKKTKISDTDNSHELFTPPGAAEKEQNLTNTNQFHHSSRSSSRSREEHTHSSRKGSKSKRR